MLNNLVNQKRKILLDYSIKEFKCVLISEPKLILNDTNTAIKSINDILIQEKIASRFKIIVAIFVLVLTVVISIIALTCLGKSPEQTVIASALSGLLASIVLEESTASKNRLLEALKTQLNTVSNSGLQKEYLSMFLKIIETQSFSK